MPVFRLTNQAIVPLSKTSFAKLGLLEKHDLQRLLRANIGVVAPDVLIIAEEFGNWDESKRRIDLLGIDRDAKLVVFELKRTDDGGHMELQAIRYAAMVSRMTFARAVKVYQSWLDTLGSSLDAHKEILAFLTPSVPENDDVPLGVRIVLVAADFAKELTTAVLWLNEWELDIRCVRVKPYADGDSVILEVQQVVPLPEAAEYQVALREEAQERRAAAREGRGFTGYYYMNVGQHAGHYDNRAWEDCKRYGFLSAGGSAIYQDHAKTLKMGDKVFAYLSGHGYVGLGEVVAQAVPLREFIPAGLDKRLLDLPMKGKPKPEHYDNPERCDWCVSLHWIKAVERDQAVLQNRFRRPTFQPIKQQQLVDELLTAFGLPSASTSAAN